MSGGLEDANRSVTKEEQIDYWKRWAKGIGNDIHFLSLDLTPDHPAIKALGEAQRQMVIAEYEIHRNV